MSDSFVTPWPVAHQAIPSMGSWDFPGKNTGVGCHFLLQGSFPTQGLNSCLLHHRQTFYHEPPGQLVPGMFKEGGGGDEVGGAEVGGLCRLGAEAGHF